MSKSKHSEGADHWRAEAGGSPELGGRIGGLFAFQVVAEPVEDAVVVVDLVGLDGD
jgi:hypothetical protein